jgi:nicotinamide-nucleotide amidase
MRAEIFCVGTELLLGKVVNTNATFLSRELAKLGIDCFYQTTVGDNKERIKDALKIAFERADLIITTGGLGPTADDLTVETIAEFFGQPLILDEKLFAIISDFIKIRGKEINESQKRQAMRPLDAQAIPNATGTAPGLLWDVSKYLGFDKAYSKLIMSFPGVPKELYSMWRETAAKFLQNIQGDKKQLFIRDLKFYGISESALAEKASEFLEQENPTVAPYTGEGECLLRLACKATNEDEALKQLDSTEKKILDLVGEYFYGYNEDSLQSVVAELLKRKNKTVAVAESCTGGLISKRLTDIPGSSSFVRLNVTTYSNESKNKLLGVAEELLQNYGAVSEEVALEMARGIKNLAQTSYGLAVTGVAGPDGGTENKPVGTVYVALVGEGLEEVNKLFFGPRTREDIRWFTSQEALNMLRKNLLKPNG